MNLSRRQFIASSAAVSASAGLISCSNKVQNQWLVSASSDRQGNHYAMAVNANGKVVSKVKLPDRAHDSLALPHKPGHALIVARRPDRFLIEVDFVNAAVTRELSSQADTHFYGHAALSADNKYLFTTENHFASGRGLVVVRDAANYQVLARYDSGGIGPHELALMPDGNTLVIANGGIQTHPMTPRVKLNLNSMRPNLAYFDIQSGKVLDTFEPPNHQQSLRHLDVAEDGSVFVGVQYQGAISEMVPLVYVHQGEAQLQALDASTEQWLSMRQYTASVLVHRNLITVSCPRANQVTYWHKQTKSFVGKDSFKDVAGLAHLRGQAYASNGLGELLQLNEKQPIQVSVEGLMFDNHMTQIQAI